ncbi:hypothetical protein AVEN_249210-1 [Araneus ventricosus]|uniref:Transposable element P transposase-like RNase H domain-containing protein n=1 Tax=Araneus ventricosus TaxID=182803 RepID=A0A4Y2MBS6_ARAVE|nr:hypothetical protein AVEN_249210-1 [Araneus ventricosus]
MQGKSTKERRWSAKEKSFALQIYLHNPRAYRILRKYFAFRSKATLHRYTYNVSKAPGFCPNLVKCLKIQSSRMSESEKLCVLSIHEMAIKPGYTYAEDLDCVDGFTTFKQDYKEKPPYATSALVFMARGVVKNWKQEFSAFRKLTKKHIAISGFKKMNVKLAAQVLSHSVAAALNLYVAAQRIESNAIDTARFLKKMEKLFDTVNSRTLKHQKKELCAVTKNSCHVEIWKDMISWIKTWSIRSSKGKTIVAPCKNG